MILKVFDKIGTKLSICEAYLTLVSLYTSADHIYPKRKAAGSLGGAVHGGTIILKNGYYTRIK